MAQEGPEPAFIPEPPVKPESLKVDVSGISHDSPHSSSSRPTTSPNSAASQASQEAEALRQSRLASYASVDRLLAQRNPPTHGLVRPTSVEAREPDRSHIVQPTPSHQRAASANMQVQVPQWQKKAELMEAWTEQPPQHFQDTTFDFGFSDHGIPNQSGPEHSMAPYNDGSFPSSMLPPDAWPHPLVIPQAPFHESSAAELQEGLQSPDFPLPAYPDSRRGSGTDSLADNFGSFALATPTHEVPPPMLQDSHIRHPDNQVDLAARRKRPRPAALTSASLRSRSYGALTSVSPTIRSGFTPPVHTVRHVKSTGHSLNAHYAGIRKPSSAQRSPLNVSTFAQAEAEAFQNLMAQHANDPPLLTSTTMGSSTPVPSPGLTINTQIQYGPPVQTTDMARSYQLAASQHLTLSTVSPPATPFASDFNPHAQYHAPPVSAPPQYASFADTTPPYSAGPMTNSSWPDAPLTSPDVANFSATYLPPLPAMSHGDPGMHVHHPLVLPSDDKIGYDGVDTPPDAKPAEFFIQEFPNQREAHAQVAQQLSHNKPKNYVFANSAPSDYDHA
jgi:hypothetical protein